MTHGTSSRLGRRVDCACLFMVLVLSLALTGCTSLRKRVQNVLEDHRESPLWVESRSAFGTIVTKYAHAGLSSATEDELDRRFEQFVTLDVRDVADLVQGQGCVPSPTASGPSRFYLVHAAHRRHDAFFTTGQPHPLRGAGGRSLHAAFSANLVFERFDLASGDRMPKRARQGAFPTWRRLRRALTKRSVFKRTFPMRSADQAKAIRQAASDLDWKQAQIELFMAAELANDAIFSPALNALYVIRPRPRAEPSLYLIVSASASGEPQTPYPVSAQLDDVHQSITGFSFSYLSDEDNPLDYVVQLGRADGSYDITITTAFAGRPEQPYLTADIRFLPTADDDPYVTLFRTVPGVDVIMLLRKGALMRDLIKQYYPDSRELKVWDALGALSVQSEIREGLTRAGLNPVAGQIEGALWLSPPRVGTSRPAPERPCDSGAR